MQKIEIIKQKGIPLMISIFLPILILGVTYYRIGIYPGSMRTILASDAYPQLSNFLAGYHHALHGKQSLFYSWSGSLGLNFWSLSAYYMNSIFSFLVYFFDNSSMADTIYFLTLVRFGAIGGSFWLFSSHQFRLPRWLLISFSVSYALMSYTVAYSPMSMWLDSMMYLPLVIWGVHRLIEKQRPGLLFVSYFSVFVSNFYLAFMIGVFSFLYFFVIYLGNQTKNLKIIGSYFLTSILASGASMIMILPTILDLKNNGEALTDIKEFFTPDTGPWDLVTKSMIGSYDTAKFEGAPFIYVGLFPLLFALIYFILPQIKRRQKIVFGALLLFLIASIYIQPLNLFWHGFHAPNMLLFRYSFLISFLSLILAMKSLSAITKEDKNRIIIIGIILLIGILSSFFFANRRRYDYLSLSSLVYTLCFLLIYILFALSFLKNKRTVISMSMILFFLAASSLEIWINSEAMIKGVMKDWTYPLRTANSSNYHDIKTLVETSKKKSPEFYRMENLDPLTMNDSFKYGYSGVSLFSSIRNRHSSQYLDQLGYRSEGTNLKIAYKNNTLLMDSVLGVRYLLAKEDPQVYGFNEISQQGNYKLYENSLALPLGVLTADQGKAATQEELVAHLAGERPKGLIQYTEPKEIKQENLEQIENDGFTKYAEKIPGNGNKLVWQISIPAKTQAYLNLVDISNIKQATLELTVGNRTKKILISEVGSYYNLGYYEEKTTVNVELSFQRAQAIALSTPKVALISMPIFEQTIAKIQQKKADLTVAGRKVTGTVKLQEDGRLWTSIPYDQGWSAYVDGEKVPTKAFNKAFVTVPLKKGTHQISLTYLPVGFKRGLILCVCCWSLFLIYYLRLSKTETKKESNHEKLS